MQRSWYADEDDDRPRRRRRDDDPRHSGGPPVGLVVGGGVGLALLSVRDGRKLGDVRMSSGVRRIGMNTPADRLWFGFHASGTALGKAASMLGSVYGPKAGMPVTRLELTERGPRWQ